MKGRKNFMELLPTKDPAFCLIIKQMYCPSYQKIAKSFFLC